MDVEATGTENPLVPPMFPLAADKTSDITYPVPGLRMVTAVTPPPLTVIFAVPPVPKPPVSGIFMYVAAVPPAPGVIDPSNPICPEIPVVAWKHDIAGGI
jgi:hypothetical protein